MSTFNEWSDVAKVLPHVPRLLLYGPPGTGKTTLGFSDCDREVIYVPLHEESQPAELLGHFISVGDRFVWLDGPITRAYRHGARLIIDEIDKASASVMDVLHAALNDPGIARIEIPDPSLATASPAELADMVSEGQATQMITPAEGFQVIATMNGLPEDLPEALLDRFDAQICVIKPHPEAILALPEDLRRAAESTTNTADDRRISLRRWKAFASLRTAIGEDTASRAVFGTRHGDVMDALRLHRDSVPEFKPEAPKAPEAPEAPKVETAVDIASAPTAYYLKTGRRGRPPRAECSVHGKMTHRSGVITDTGDLHCRKCSTKVAGKNTFTRKVLVAGDWITA